MATEVLRYTFRDLAQEVFIKNDNKEMTSREIWEYADSNKIIEKLSGITGSTPWISLNTVLQNSSTEDIGLFLRSPGKPAKYKIVDDKVQESKKAIAEIKSIKIQEEILDEPSETPLSTDKQIGYLEREIHPWLVNFAKFELGNVIATTIFHEKSTKKGGKQINEWVHPDLVGFWYPFIEYSDELKKIGSSSDLVKFYSFEMKREIKFGNLRESFFQAVSNSSWAHEGYLVAANIDENELLRLELGRLSGSFGIGIIEIDVDEPERSTILFPAKHKKSIDWEGANKLAGINVDFKKFLKEVQTDINSNLHQERYDAIESIDSLKKKAMEFQLRKIDKDSLPVKVKSSALPRKNI
jgi:hypothetical protein